MPINRMGEFSRRVGRSRAFRHEPGVGRREAPASCRCLHIRGGIRRTLGEEFTRLHTADRVCGTNGIEHCHDGPIGRRKCGYILTTDQSDAPSTYRAPWILIPTKVPAIRTCANVGIGTHQAVLVDDEQRH
eukprot:8329853-Pyramimonas_sp.AAC.1